MRFWNRAALVAAILATPAVADDCKPLTIVTSVDIQVTRPRAAVFAPVTMDGVQKMLLVDTGGAFGEITKDTADELKLDREPVNVAVVDVSGEASYEAGRVKDLTIGNLHASNVDFIIARHNPFGEGNGVIAGILAPDFLMNYDVEFDFGAGKMTLLSPDHCPGKVVYWPAAAVAIVPIHVAKGGHVALPVTLDGQRITAMLDTGASDTIVNLGTAEEKYGLAPDSPGVTPAGALNGSHGAPIWQHRFKTLAFGDENGNVTVANPQALLVPNLQGSRHETEGTLQNGTRLKPKDNEQIGLPDMLLGMSVLRHLHIYIAYGEQRLYVTAASAPPKP
ncbi:MAG TPA: aspartyl protease family protein [Rhizomicrobium sp.]|nr:aspartyl protease family protein [Rhizomicrobium sp.]